MAVNEKLFRVYDKSTHCYVDNIEQWAVKTDGTMLIQHPLQGTYHPCNGRQFIRENGTGVLVWERPEKGGPKAKQRWVFENDILVEDCVEGSPVYIVVFNDIKRRWQIQYIDKKGAKRKALTPRVVARKKLVWAGTAHDERYACMTID